MSHVLNSSPADLGPRLIQGTAYQIQMRSATFCNNKIYFLADPCGNPLVYIILAAFNLGHDFEFGMFASATVSF